MNKKIKKVIALAMAGCMALGMTACGKEESADTQSVAKVESPAVQAEYTAAPGSVSKTETVYVNLKSDGKVDTVSVSDWLHTDVGEVCVKDVSNLKNIQNVKSDIVPITDGTSLKWHMPTTDIYYSGETNEKPPVEFSLHYYLNGRETEPEDMAGKSGQVKITVDMKNNMSKTVTVDGKKTKVYLPLLVVGGTVMSEQDFNGITVENGRSIGDGSKEIVVFFGMPGMDESLGLSQLELGELSDAVTANSASITAATDSFALGNMYFAVIPLSSLNLGAELPETVEDLKATLQILKEVQSSITDIDPNAIISALVSDSGSVNSLMHLVSDAMALYNNNKALIELMSKYMSGENGKQLTKLLTLLGSDESGALLDFLSKYDLMSLIDGLSALSDSVPLAEGLSKDLNTPAVQQALQNLPETLEKLNNIREGIAENQELIDALTDLLSDDNIKNLSALAQQLNSADLGNLSDKYASLAAHAGDLAQRASAWMEYGQSYRLFTDAAPEMTTAVTFIYMTPSVKAPARAAATQEAQAEEGFFAKLFGRN